MTVRQPSSTAASSSYQNHLSSNVASPGKERLLSILNRREEQIMYTSPRSPLPSLFSYHKSKPRTHLFVIDNSPHSQAAVEEAILRFVDKRLDKLMLMNIRRPIELDEFAVKFGDLKFLEYMKISDDKARDKAHNLLHSYSSNLAKRGYTVTAVAIRGDTIEEVKRKVALLKPDLVVIGVSN
ncbi:hypothetical protein BKA69DRAFT_159960 [Paraphysoderma sedebokerense]|nr:hypothetical protein BKA69DRAFT_159960 [Paraphysoderma sedebokerense]